MVYYPTTNMNMISGLTLSYETFGDHNWETYAVDKNSQTSIIGHLYGQSIHWIVFKPLFNGHRSTTASFFCSKGSLRRRRNLTQVSIACEAAPRSLLWDPNGLNKLPEVRLRFPFNLIGKSIMAFLTDQSWRVLKFCYTGGGPEQVFRCCLADEP